MPETSPPPPDPLRLPAALAARICHDIAGPLGSLAGTLDMLAEDGDPEALALARESAAVLSARLRLLRAAWAGEVEVPGTRVMQALVPGLPNAERLRVTLELDPVMAPALRRLGLNLLLLGTAALPRGGDITLQGHDGGLRLRVDGRNAAWPPALAACAHEGASAAEASALASADPRGLAVPMACLLAAAQGLRITLLSETELTAAPA
jgi:histidine phosphotransferase ChpT